MDAYKQYLGKYRTKQYAKGQVIIHQGDEPAYAYVIKQGYVKLYEITADGSEKPILFDRQYDTFPIAWVFGHQKVAQYFYEALTDCEIHLVPRDEYMEFLRQNPEAMLALTSSLAQRYADNQVRILALEQLKAHDKIFHTLRFLAARFGSQSAANSNEWEVNIPLTQQDFANFVGLTRETTGIELKKLERAGVISYSKQEYIINRKKFDDLLLEK